jgi:phosphoesterase RecJ-like protein
MENPFDAALRALRASSTVIVTTHRNPDGDAIGSALGMWHMLRAMGKSATVVLPNAPPSNLIWMEGASSMRVYDPDLDALIDAADTVVVLDLNAVSRLEALGSAIMRRTDRTIINIDHHTKPEAFATVQWIDEEACSTASMVCDLAAALGVLTADMAMGLYTGIMTDTGSFRFPRTTASVHRTVATLIEAGADPVRAYDEVMNRGSVGRAQLLGLALSTMGIHAEGRLCTMVVRSADMERFGCTTEDTEGFVAQTLALQGVTMGILFVERPDEVKISFRSKGNAYVRDLAARYGGGGHVYAAGARVLGGTVDTVVPDVISAAVESL